MSEAQPIPQPPDGATYREVACYLAAIHERDGKTRLAALYLGTVADLPDEPMPTLSTTQTQN